MIALQKFLGIFFVSNEQFIYIINKFTNLFQFLYFLFFYLYTFIDKNLLYFFFFN